MLFRRREDKAGVRPCIGSHAPSFQIAERASREGTCCVQRVNAQVDHLIRFKSFRCLGGGGILEVRVGGQVVAKRVQGHFPDTAEIVKAVAAAAKAC